MSKPTNSKISRKLAAIKIKNLNETDSAAHFGAAAFFNVLLRFYVKFGIFVFISVFFVFIFVILYSAV